MEIPNPISISELSIINFKDVQAKNPDLDLVLFDKLKHGIHSFLETPFHYFFLTENYITRVDKSTLQIKYVKCKTPELAMCNSVTENTKPSLLDLKISTLGKNSGFTIIDYHSKKIFDCSSFMKERYFMSYNKRMCNRWAVFHQLLEERNVLFFQQRTHKVLQRKLIPISYTKVKTFSEFFETYHSFKKNGFLLDVCFSGIHIFEVKTQGNSIAFNVEMDNNRRRSQFLLCITKHAYEEFKKKLVETDSTWLSHFVRDIECLYLFERDGKSYCVMVFKNNVAVRAEGEADLGFVKMNINLAIVELQFDTEGKITKFVQAHESSYFENKYHFFSDISFKIEKCWYKQQFLMTFSYVGKCDEGRTVSKYDYFMVDKDIKFVKVLRGVDSSFCIQADKEKSEVYFYLQNKQSIFKRKVNLDL